MRGGEKKRQDIVTVLKIENIGANMKNLFFISKVGEKK